MELDQLIRRGASVSGPSPTEKVHITSTCERFIEDILKPRFLPVVRPTEFNYPVNIQGKWHGARYRLIQRYRSGFADNLGYEFDAPFVRLDWLAPDSFNIQWHRHTGVWHCLYRFKTLRQALRLIETDGILQPN